jgi:hypothetical protein
MGPENFTDPNIQAQHKAQAPARWFGSCLALVIGLFACIISIGAWYFFSKDAISALADSISLQTHGVTTTGTITETEEFTEADPALPQSSYKITVSFEVDGVTYSVKGSSFYKPNGKDLMGQSEPIIYAPEDPNVALIDTFQERWLNPITDSLP